MTEDQITAASKDIAEFVRKLVKPWVDLRGHETRFAKIIAKHASAAPATSQME